MANGMSDALKAAFEKAGIDPARFGRPVVPTAVKLPPLQAGDPQNYQGMKLTHIGLDELNDIQDKHLADALAFGQTASRIHRVEKTVRDFSDAELIMEMIRRGYAAMKIPEGKDRPEALG